MILKTESSFDVETDQVANLNNKTNPKRFNIWGMSRYQRTKKSRLGLIFGGYGEQN